MKILRKLQQMSLRFQVAAGVGLGFLSLFGLLGYLAVTDVQRASEAALRERVMLAESTAAKMDTLLVHAKRQLENMAATARIPASGEPEQAFGNDLRRGFSIMDTYSAVALMTSRGEVLAAEHSRMPFLLLEPASQPVIRQALQTGRTAMGVAQAGPESHPPIVVVAVPVSPRDSQAPLLIVGEMHLWLMKDSLALPSGQSKTFVTEVTDGQGRVLASNTLQEGVQINYHVNILAPLVAARQAGVRLHEEARWPAHVVAYAPLTILNDGTGVVVEEQEDVVMAVPLDLRKDMILFGIGALALVSAGAWLHARSVVQPLEKLATASQRIAQGNLDEPVRVSRGDEIGLLAAIFESMRVQLKEGHEARLRWEKELEERVRERTKECHWLLGKTISAQEEERQRIARELHDSVAQSIAALLVTLQATRNAMPSGLDRDKVVLKQAVAQGTQALADMRRMIADLRPAALDDLGFIPALRAWAQERLEVTGVKARVEVDGPEGRLPGPVETALFRILQEAITNVAKHARAHNVTLHLTFDRASLVAQVVDDGVGFDVPVAPGGDGRGVGLQSMRERAGLIGGALSIESAPGKGTRVRVEVPLPKEEAHG